MMPHPYPGLRPFKREESDIFFGREQHVDQLLEKLGQHHFLAVVGTSGCGKSSLVKAGMLPALDAGFLARAGARWYVVDMRPGHRPMWALAESLVASQAFGPGRGNAMESLALLHATLRRGPLGLVEAMRETPLPNRANLLVLVDQFEEIFRYRRDIDSQEADAFVALLVASARQREFNVYITLTMRSDFLGDCAVFLDLPETINESQFLAPRLTRDQRAAAITEPARVFGGDVEPGLVNRMLNDMGADPDQLPLMQHALMRMWDRASAGSSDDQSAQGVGANGIARVVLSLEHYRGKELHRLSHEDSVSAVSFSPDGKTLASGSEDKTVRVWDLATGKELQRLSHDSTVRAVSFSPDGKTLASGSWENTVRVWDLATGKELQRLSHDSFVNAVSFSPDGKTLASASPDKTVRLWDLATGKELQQFSHDSTVTAVSFSPDGKTLASASPDKTVRLWDLATGKELQRLPHGATVNAVSFSPDGKTLVSGSGDGFSKDNTIRLWSLDTGTELQRWSHDFSVKTVSFSPDGKTLASASPDKTVRLWDLATGKELRRLSHDSYVNAVSFSPDGKTLASASPDKTVRVWDLATNVGGLSEALSSHADEALAELKDEREKRIAERIFKRLTKREEGERDTRDPTTLRELVGITEAPVEEVIRVINVFSQAGRSFLTPHLESSPTPALDTIIDISHESLIRQWDTLKNWVIDEAKSADTYLRLEETARLYRAKNADPYRGLDLQGALQWRKTEKPTDAWAKRYGAKGKETEAFEGAIAFLEESARNRDKEQASQERRWRITFFSVCGVMIGFMVAALYMGWLWQSAEAEQNKAIALKLAAEGQLAENRHSNQLQLHALLAIESTKRYPSPLANQSLRHALDLMAHPLATMLHEGPVSAVSFSPDGRTLASGSEDNTVRVWDLATGKELQRLSHDFIVNAVSFSPDGKILASGSDDSTVRLWDLATGKELQRWWHEAYVNAVSFSPDGKSLASGSGDNTVRLSDLTTGKELQRLSHGSPVTAVSFSPDGKTLASGSSDNTVGLWDLTTGKELQRLSHGSPVTAVSFSPDGKTLASGSHDNTVRVWDLATGKELQRWWHEAYVNAVSFSPDGKSLASGSEETTVRVWDLATGKELQRLSHDSDVNAVSFSPDGKTLASGNQDNTVRVWDLATAKEPQRLSHEGSVNAVSFSPDGKSLASGSWDNAVRLWDLATGKEQQRLPHEDDVTAVSFSPDGKTLASGSADNTVRLWDLAMAKELQRLSHEDLVTAVSFSPDGKTLASGGHTVRVWDLATGKEQQRWSHEDDVNAVSFSPDGKTLASGSDDNIVRFWDLATGKLQQRWSHEGPVNAVSFSPDEKALASGSWDNTVRLWDLATGKELQRLPHDSPVYAVGFSPDAKTLASGSADKTVRVWDVATGKEQQRLPHEGNVNAVSFSPDGRILASGSYDNTVRLWLWQPQDLIVAACQRSTRNLRWDEWKLYLEDLPYGKTCEHLPVHESVVGYAQQLAKASATLDPIAEADRWQRKGKVEKILIPIEKLWTEKKYAELIGLAGEAFQLDPTAVPNKAWNDICWNGALDGQAFAVMRACDRAVERASGDDPIHNFRGSRGLARALAGNTQGAIEDFEFFIDHTDDAEQKSQRQAWVGVLKAGKNPFTLEVLKSLRGQ